MKAFIVTVAGQSTRFNQGFDVPVLKCLYHTERTPECILYRLLRQASHAGCDRLIVVGGYRFEELERAVSTYTAHTGYPITLRYNPRWRDSGSMYSLYYGVEAAAESSEILFCEGDIIVDDNSFQQICSIGKDSFAIALEPIYASRAVAAYQGLDNRLHYLYDIRHEALTFPAGVKAVFHSAQAWKISDARTFKQLNAQLTESERQGTNLVLIEKYFKRFPMEAIEPSAMRHWINCNTRDDFDRYERDKKLFDSMRFCVAESGYADDA